MPSAKKAVKKRTPEWAQNAYTRHRAFYNERFHDFMAAMGEFCGTVMFLFLALGGTQSAKSIVSTGSATVPLDNQTVLYIALSFGMSLVVNAWAFFRVTGAAFNPAVTLALFLIGSVSWFRAILLVIAQLLGGIVGAALVSGLTPGTAFNVGVVLQNGTSIAQGLFIEMFITASLVFSVLMLASEKHKSTYLAPVGIGLTLFSCELMALIFTGGSANPARAIGPDVVNRSFPQYTWIYYVGPILGSLLATLFYSILKHADYEKIVGEVDTADANASPDNPMQNIAAMIPEAVNLGLNREEKNETPDLETGGHVGNGGASINGEAVSKN